MRFDNAYFITGTAYAGKSTMVKLLAEKYNGILCEENYHDQMLPGLDSTEFPFLTYTRDLEDWHDFIRRTPEEYKAWMDGVSRECEILELRLLDGLKDQGRPVFVDTNYERAEIEDYFYHNIYSVDPPIKIFVKPDEKRQAYLLKTCEEPVRLSDGRIVIVGDYEPPSIEDCWVPDTRLYVFDSQEAYDKTNDLESYNSEEEPFELSEIPLDILKELVSLNKAEVISFKELEELYNSPKDFVDAFNMYEEFYPIAIA